MSIFKVVILSLALLLAVEAVGPFRSHDDADTRKFGEERVHPPDSAAKSATVLVNRFKLWFWRLTGEVPENLFSKLKLDQATAGLLSNPKFSIWTEFVKATKTNYEASMIGVLMKKLPGTILSEVIAAGMKNPKTEKIAMMLQEQRFHFLKEENFQPADAFTNVGMSVKENFFSHPTFERWLQYTSEFNSDKSSRMDNLCKAIGTKPVIERLDEGMRIGSTKEKATNLYNELLENFVEKEYAPAQFLDVQYIKCGPCTRNATSPSCLLRVL